MNRCCIVSLFAVALSSVASAQSASRNDSSAKHDSVALADSVALIATVEQELGANASDTSASRTATAPAHPAAVYMNIGLVSLTDAGWSTEPNVSALQRGDHDPAVRGFTLPNTELTLEGAVDPYLKASSSVVLKLDQDGETRIELEEAYLLTNSLPANLQLKGGQFFVEFGRQNSQHPHSWSFVDQPLILNRMFGPDGLRSQGVRLSWLVPTPFYAEALLTLVNSTGETTHSFRSPESTEIHGGVPVQRRVVGLGEMLVVPRITTSFEITETQTFLLGASGAFGPNNSGPRGKTSVLGVDGYWKWKPDAAEQGFPFLSLQAEALTRHYDAAQRESEENPPRTLAAEILTDRGAYGQLLWGIKPRIVAGLRTEVAKGSRSAFPSELRMDRVRTSPNFTWYPTEFSKFRIQYNYDHRKGIGTDHSLWFQVEFLLGAHASHKF